jgi:hypothetical protein
MRRTLAACLVALSLALTVTPAVVFAAGDGTAGSARTAARVRSDVAPVSSRDRATRALERAQALFGPAAYSARGTNGRTSAAATKHRDASIVMRNLFAAKGDLSPAQRKIADSILARPTDGPNDQYGYGYTVPAVKKCQGNFCIHWVTSTADAPPSQLWVNQMLRLMNRVWKKEVQKLGYRPPVSDQHRGGNGKFDVYLKELGDGGLYGFCAPERRKPGFQWLASGFCVLDNDFSQLEFPLPPMQSAEVTAAHEFFHAIQFGYDYGEDAWLLEATATWMEERLYDEVNDNRQYLTSGQVYDSLHPLDFFNSGGSEQYGNWAFFEFLSKNYGNGVVKSIWNKAAAFTHAPDMYSTQAISSVLKPKGGFKKVYSRFASANTVPAKFYPEGQAWPATFLMNDASPYKLTRSQRRTGTHGTHLLHMSSASWLVKSSSSLKSKKWYLKIKVDGPGSYRMPAAYVLVVKRHGTDKRYVALNGKGNGQVIVPFGRKKVKSVYVTLVNASTRFKCGKGYQFSCSGLPIDDGRNFHGQRYRFSGAVVKR